MLTVPIELPASGMPWVALAIVVPLGAGLAAILLGVRASYLALPTALAGILIAAGIVDHVYSVAPIYHEVGGWAAPLGIALRVDGMASAFLGMTAIITGGIVLFAARAYNVAAVGSRAVCAFWPTLFMMWAALNAVFMGSDLFNLYVALELLTLTAITMVALGGTAENLAAAMRYLLFAVLGSLSYLLGVALIYGDHGALDLVLLSHVAVPGASIAMAGALITVGLMAKTALFPLHGWLPPAHAGAPTAASAMLSALVVKASFYVLVRIWFTGLHLVATPYMTQILGVFGAAAIIFGSISALRQVRLKLVIAYSTVAQLGYLFLIFPLAGGATIEQPWSAGAWTGGILLALAHAPAKAAMFLAAGAMLQTADNDRLDGLAGVWRTAPLAVFAFGIASLSLMGLPPSGGFLAKYLLLTAAMASGQWWWVSVIVIGGLLSAAYVFRVFNHLLAASPENRRVPRRAIAGQAIAMALALVSALLGVISLDLYDLLQIGTSKAAEEGLS